MFSRKEPIKEAVGVSYDAEDIGVPIVSVKGQGAMAEAIIAMAEELGVYVHKDEQLLKELKCLREGQEVPRELFEVIAQVLSFSYILQGKNPVTWQRSNDNGQSGISINA